MSNKKIAKIFFNVFLLALFESLAPIGAVNTLMDETVKTIGTVSYTHLTLPTNREV